MACFSVYLSNKKMDTESHSNWCQMTRKKAYLHSYVCSAERTNEIMALCKFFVDDREEMFSSKTLGNVILYVYFKKLTFVKKCKY